MNINAHNYEAFFLDYHEGNLTPQEVAELLLFVEQHPELKPEFESFENFTLEDLSSYSFENKDQLKKGITAENKDAYFIRSVDGTLTSTETDLLNTFLKQHPQFSTEFELFHKTKLKPDTTIIFENKDLLKRMEETADNLLIASIEGLLSSTEQTFLKEQLAIDPQMREDLAVYQHTKLSADASVVYENKEELKQIAAPVHFTRIKNGWEDLTERKIAPYIIGIAASILLLVGIFQFFSNNTTEQNIAKTEINPVTPKIKNESVNSISVENKLAATTPNTATPFSSAVVKNNNQKKNNITPVDPKNSLKEIPVINNEQKTVNLAQQAPENKKQEAPQEQIVPANNEQPITNNSNAIAKADTKEKAPSKEFLSLGQIAAEKIKSKTLDADVIASEQKTDRLKKISGWDIAQVVAKGVSKITGKKVEAKPTYNDEGEVTAFALGAGGFQFSRGK